MTKAELINRVYGKKNLPHGLTRKTVMQIVDSVFTEMGDYFIRAKATRVTPAKLTYPGFGTFSKRRRTERSGLLIIRMRWSSGIHMCSSSAR